MRGLGLATILLGPTATLPSECQTIPRARSLCPLRQPLSSHVPRLVLWHWQQRATSIEDVLNILEINTDLGVPLTHSIDK